jgi:cytochrome c oxidase assembly protein subunit 11
MAEHQEPTTPNDVNESAEPARPTQEMVENNKRTGKKMLAFIAFMFLVAAASIPLYRIVCVAIDPGGSSWQNGETDSYEGVTVDKSRTVKVRFAAEVNRQLPWRFEATESSVTVHPGEKRLTNFVSENLDGARAIKGQAVYDINPPEAGQYFKKIECFCFTEQTLEPGEQVDMPLYFWFEPDMPDHIKEITLAYTFFNADTSRKRAGETAAITPGK